MLPCWMSKLGGKILMMTLNCFQRLLSTNPNFFIKNIDILISSNSIHRKYTEQSLKYRCAAVGENTKRGEGEGKRMGKRGEVRGGGRQRGRESPCNMLCLFCYPGLEKSSPSVETLDNKTYLCYL